MSGIDAERFDLRGDLSRDELVLLDDCLVCDRIDDRVASGAADDRRGSHTKVSGFDNLTLLM
jgi:hypothetical protein